MNPSNISIYFKDETDNELTFTNDLGVNNIGDPFMLKVAENEYYLYCTSAPNGFYVWKSEDMIHWGSKKMCYKHELDSWNFDCFWAPEVVVYKDKYYLFYTAHNQEKSLRIGLAISDSPMGPFLDYENKPLLDLGYATLDANVFIDDDGKKYMYFSRDCSENIVDGNHISQLYGIRLADDMKSTVGEPVFLTTPEQLWEKPQGGWGWNEGPEMIKHNGTYYLTYSANYFESPYYSLGVAISSEPLGNFEKPNYNPILTKGERNDVSGTGHHGFVESPDGTEIWMAYHSHTFIDNPSGNRKVNIAKVLFSDDDRIIVEGPTTSPQLRPSGNGVVKSTGAYTFTFDNTSSVYSLSSEKEESISALCIHFSQKPESDISLQLIFDDEKYSEKKEVLINDDKTLTLVWDTIDCKEIKLVFSAPVKINSVETVK